MSRIAQPCGLSGRAWLVVGVAGLRWHPVGGKGAGHRRHGLLTRHVFPVSPVAVEYAITPLGRTLLHPLKVMHDWTMDKLPAVVEARRAFDQRGAG